MKTLAVIALCLWPWTVEAQYELPACPCGRTPVVHRSPIRDDSVIVNYPVRVVQEQPITRADLQRMIDSAVVQIGRWEPRLHVLDRCPERRDGCLVNHLPSEWIYDTVWVFVRREDEP